jgi:hypothetical protein
MMAACSSTDKDTEDTDTVVECDNGIVSITPADSAQNVYYRSDINVLFEAADENATCFVSNAGVEVPGSTMWMGDTMMWQGDAPLDSNTTYDVALSYECGEPTTTFTTSEVGGESDPADLNGRTYVLDLAGGNFVQPAGVGALLQTQLTVDILIGVTDASTAEVEMMGALGLDGASPAAQDTCQETIDFPTPADFSENPFFSVGPDTTTLSVQGMEVTIDDLLISGAFSPDGSYIAGATLAGAVDTRPLVGLIDPEGSDNTICDLVATFGVACEPCSDGSGDYCLTLLVNDISAEELPNTTLVTRSEADIAADASCN